MKGFLFAIGFAFTLPVLAAQQEAMKMPSRTSASPEASLQMAAITPRQVAPPAYKAVIGMNLVDITKSKGNIWIDTFLKPQAGLSLSYSGYSQDEVRNKLAGSPKLSVDRTQFGIGGAFYFMPLESTRNISFSPGLIFQTEKDAIQTEKNSGIEIRLLGSVKPLDHLLMQAGAVATIVGSDQRADAYAGVGLLF